MSKLKLYVKPEFQELDVRSSPLLYPFWGNRAKDSVTYPGAFTDHVYDKSHYEIVSDPQDCDCHFLPFNFWALKKKAPQVIKNARDTAAQFNKKLLIDAFGDTMDQINIPGSIILRFAQYRRSLQPNDIIVPAYIEDLLYKHCKGRLKVRNIKETPSVGFVGWASLSFRKYPKTFIKEVPIWLLSRFIPSLGIYRKGVFLRSESLRIIESEKAIKLDQVIRETYSGNIKTASEDPELMRRQFIDNILENDYTLCVKGDANQSTRFFEVLSLGRIPLVLDTECVFPLEDAVPYREFCIFIDYREIGKIGRQIKEVHAKISAEQFLNMQKEARRIYEEFLRTDVFTKHLVGEIRKRL